MCCAVLGLAALAAAGRRSWDNRCGCGCDCGCTRFEPRMNVIRASEPSCSCNSCCCCGNTTAVESSAPSVSCEAAAAFERAMDARNNAGNRGCGCGCR